MAIEGDCVGSIDREVPRQETVLITPKGNPYDIGREDGRDSFLFEDVGEVFEIEEVLVDEYELEVEQVAEVGKGLYVISGEV